MKISPDAPCPCRADDADQLSYQECCGPWHAGRADLSALPPTSEALMRSRYSAFVLELGDYLLATWHESTAPRSIEFESDIQWLGLKIIRTRAGSAASQRGLVEFVARYRVEGTVSEQREASTFVRESGAWYYVAAL